MWWRQRPSSLQRALVSNVAFLLPQEALQRGAQTWSSASEPRLRAEEVVRSLAAASRAAAPACADSLLPARCFCGDPDDAPTPPQVSRPGRAAHTASGVLHCLATAQLICCAAAAAAAIGYSAHSLQVDAVGWGPPGGGVARPLAVASESSDAALAPDILLTDCFSPAQPPPPLPNPPPPPLPPCCDARSGLTGQPVACSVAMGCLCQTGDVQP